jgi:hypothetical protein
MAKASIPNVNGHYEMNGIEIDVNDRQIIVRVGEGNRDRNYDTSRHHQQKPVEKRADKKEDSPFGPVTTKLLQNVGILGKEK